MNSRLEKSEIIVFDIGNVLLEYSPAFLLKKSLNIDDERYIKGVFQSPYWIRLDEGTVSIEEAAFKMSIEAGLEEQLVIKLLSSFTDFMPEMPAISLIESMKEQGKKVYLLSNFQKKAFEQVRLRHEFFQKIDGWLVSSHVNINKPNPDIYRLLMDKFRLEAKKCCFIDDTLENIEAAKKLGFETIHYKSINSLL